MLAPVLLFRRRAAPRDWTDQDKAEFFRVIDVLGRAGIPLELETGLTDEGEPWAVFCAVESGEPVVHVARLGQHYVLAATTLAEPMRGADLRSLVRTALRDVPAAVLPTSDRGVLTLHPAALLLVLVATCWFQAAHAGEPNPEVAARLLDGKPGPVAETPAALPIELAICPEAEAQEPGGEAAALRFQHSLTLAVALLTVVGDVRELMPPVLAPAAMDMAALHTEVAPTQDATAEVIDITPNTRRIGDVDSVLAMDFTPLAEASPAPSPVGPVAHLPEDMPAVLVVAAGKAADPGGDLHLPGAEGVLVWRQDGVQVQSAESGTLSMSWTIAAPAPDQSHPGAAEATAPAAVAEPTILVANAEAAKASLVQALGTLDAYQAWSVVQPGRAVTPVAELSPDLAQKLSAVIVAETTPQPLLSASPTGVGGVAGAPSVGPGSAESGTVIEAAASSVARDMVTFVSAGGPAGMWEQQMSLDVALTQLQKFAASTPDHLTIFSGKSLVLVDPAVLANGQLHAYSSFTMADGSELAWVYPVGVAPTPWPL